MKTANRPFIYIVPVLIVAALIALYFSVQPEEPAAPAINFSEYAAGPERKAAFVGFFQPIIAAENKRVLALRSKLEKAKSTGKSGRWLEEVAEQYRVTDFNPDNPDQWRELLSRVDSVPMSLALAQAANESGWGTSRFSREGNNYFGQWCFTKGCGIVPSSRNEGATHEVASFSSPAESVRRYILNLNSHPQYAELRRIRAALHEANKPATGTALAAGLMGYSERGAEYIKELREMIEFNRWSALDDEASVKGGKNAG